MRAILSLLLIVSAVQASELRVNRGILPGGLIDDRRLLSELNQHAKQLREDEGTVKVSCLLYTSPSPRDKRQSRMPSSA